MTAPGLVSVVQYSEFESIVIQKDEVCPVASGIVLLPSTDIFTIEPVVVAKYTQVPSVARPY
jgi:hypothetical protein